MLATEQEIVALDDVAKPFATLAEIKETASLRRRIHQEMDKVLTRTLQLHPTLEDRVASGLEARPTPTVSPVTQLCITRFRQLLLP